MLLQSYKPLLRKQKESSQYCRPHQYIVSRVCQYLNIFRQTNLTPTWYWENKTKEVCFRSDKIIYFLIKIGKICFKSSQMHVNHLLKFYQQCSEG